MGSDYDYWTEETRIDSAANNAVLSVTRTTYNKYHLLTQELVRREGTLASTQIEYNLRPGLFADQPPTSNYPDVSLNPMRWLLAAQRDKRW